MLLTAGRQEGQTDGSVPQQPQCLRILDGSCRLTLVKQEASLFPFHLSSSFFFFFFLFRQRPSLSIPRFTIYGIFVGWDNNFRFLVLANLIIEINFVSSEFSSRERERDRDTSFFIFLFLERIESCLWKNFPRIFYISRSLAFLYRAKYAQNTFDTIFFFFFIILPHTFERRIRRRMDEEDEIGATPYCSVDKYSDRAREFSSLSGREKPGRKIHRSPWNDVYIPLKRESSLYERSHLPDKGTNNRSLPSPPLPSIFLVAPWTGNGDSTTSRLRNRSKSR